MSQEIEFQVVGRTLMGIKDSATVAPSESPVEALAEAVVQAISTEIEIKLGDKVVHLAMLLDIDHWADDWNQRGVEYPEEFVEALMRERYFNG
jgi:hypothetical protein